MKKLTEEELFPYRPLPFYYITTHDMAELTYEKFYADLSDMKEKGYGGVIPFNRPPEGFSEDQYFTEDWFTMIGNCLRACHELGLRVWLNDDFDAPPGTIGGRLQKIAPDLAPKRIRLVGGQPMVETVAWGFPAFEDPKSAKLFQHYVYEEYKRRFGHYFGNTVVGFFSDADSRRVNAWVYTPGSPMKDYFPWSDGFENSFYTRYGYEIRPFLPSILRREPSPQSHDYWEHCGELYMGWFASNYRWCRENGLQYTFHTSDTAPFQISRTYMNSAFAEGKAIDAGRNCDYPGTDHELLDLNGGRLILKENYQMSAAVYGGDESLRRAGNFYDTYADLRAKQAQSGAYLYDKKGVMCEMFAAVNWGASYKDLRNILSWQMMQGVSFVVLQAYHYRLHGKTKAFAPLSFGPHSHTDFAMREFNDAIAKNAYLCSRGRLRVDLALIDSTDSIWAGTGDSELQLQLAKTLNHAPQGYIITDMKGLRRKAGELKAVVNPGLPLTMAQREEIASLGLHLLSAAEAADLSLLEERLPTGIAWEGDGRVMFMRRALEDGQELLVVGNIESDETLTGRLRFGGSSYPIALSSGELAFFGGGYDDYRSPVPDAMQLALNPAVSVWFARPNILPLMRWTDEKGQVFPLLPLDERASFIITERWISPHFKTVDVPLAEYPQMDLEAVEPLENLELLVSDVFLSAYGEKIWLDGRELIPTDRTKVFDDRYTVFGFSIDAGVHTFRLHMPDAITVQDPLYLRGSFDLSIATQPGEMAFGGCPSLQIYLPDRMRFILSARRQTLSTEESWTEQGQPFYSGEVEYRFRVTVPMGTQAIALVLPSVRDAVKVYADESFVGCKIFPPYRIPLCLSEGEHTLLLRVMNTLANMLEGYRAPSGILKAPYLELVNK